MEHEHLTEVVVGVLSRWPFSRRSLAREAGVSHTQLNLIVGGELGASPRLARALLDALERRSVDLARGADELRQALDELE
jgi:hypothetical protein